MMMAEEQARTKWCPMVRQASSWFQAGPSGTAIPVSIGINRELTTSAGGSNCIASDCMMWRFRHGGAAAHDFGYCGLADRPEVAP